MPLLGHTFVGLATGMAVGPFPPDRPPATRRQRAAAALWLPMAVVLAYLPDLATQAGLLLGVPHARVAAHSILFAVAIAPPVALLGAVLGGLPAARVLAFTLGSVLLHDALDVAQSTDRQPWWPLSDRSVEVPVMLADVGQEALAFAALFAAFLAARWVFGRLRPRPPGPAGRPALVWLGRALIALLVTAAALTHSLRAAREHRLDEARGLLERHRYAEALQALAEAERWPSTAKPGRLDHLRGEAWLGLGDRRRAERYYRDSERADPGFFWLVADLAAFHASAGAPRAERQRQVEPYLERLRRDFPGHEALPGVLARIEGKLAAPAPGDR